MKKISLFVLGSLSLTGAFAQEVINPLTVVPSLYTDSGQNTRSSDVNALDSTFIYEFAPLELQYMEDDFSINKFEQFDAEFTEAGVTSELFFRLMNESNTTPLAGDAILCDSTYSRQETIFVDGGGVEIDREIDYPFTSVDVFLNDLEFYPVVGEVRSLFEECYVLIDSVIDGVPDADQDTIWYNTLPGPVCAQDSARVFTKTVSDTNVLWIDDFACHNYTMAVNPWSLGVATFDGTDQNGWPYEFGDDVAYGVADYMTSRPIDLSVADGADVVYLTFVYQKEGFGNAPDKFDSLVVEFYEEGEDLWRDFEGAWKGIPDDTDTDTWDTVRLAIPTGFYTPNFQFRFKNYASLSGSLDHWHLDYVSLEISVIEDVEDFSDVAIMYPVNTLLTDYTAVPWDHYKATSGNEKMAPEFNIKVFNSDADATNAGNGNWLITRDGSVEGDFVTSGTGGPDAANYLLGINDCFQSLGTFFYDQSVPGSSATFEGRINISTPVDGSNVIRANDTTYFTQEFKNYYAYDDGSAEAAYGLEGAGGMLAYKFEGYQAGELTGILMQFVPSVEDVTDEIMLLTVWADDDGEPGEIIYEDSFFDPHYPAYDGSKNGFKYFTFNNTEFTTNKDVIVDGETKSIKVLAVDEVFYVGWQKINSQPLNIGLDWNTNSGDRIFRNTGGDWLSSSFEISLLIRPVFSTGLDSTLSNEFVEREETFDIQLYPNPTNQFVNISGAPYNATVNFYDMTGRLVIQTVESTEIDLSDLQNGVYLVEVLDENGTRIHSSRLIKNQ